MPRDLTILLVDDDEDGRFALAAALTAAGARVREAGSAQVALLMAQSDPPDVAVMDVGLPTRTVTRCCTPCRG